MNQPALPNLVVDLSLVELSRKNIGTMARLGISKETTRKRKRSKKENKYYYDESKKLLLGG